MNGAAFDVIHADTLRFFPDLVTELGGDANALFAESRLGPVALPAGTSTYGYRLIVDLLEHAAAALEFQTSGCGWRNCRVAAAYLVRWVSS